MSKIKLNTREELYEIISKLFNNTRTDENKRNELTKSFNDTYDYSSITDMSNLFLFVNNKMLEKLPTITDNKGKEVFFLDTSNVTNMDGMFSQNINLQEIPYMNTSNVKSMKNMFMDCEKLSKLSNFDTSNVEYMNSMFQGCKSLKSIPNFDTSKVVNMSAMFLGCTFLKEVPPLDTKNVKDMSAMFNKCGRSLVSIPSLNTENVVNMNHMFDSCTKLTSIPELTINDKCTVNYSLKDSGLINGNNKITNIKDYMNVKYIEPRQQEEKRLSDLRKEEQRKSIKNAINELRETNNKKNEKNLTGGYSLSL